MKLDRMDNKRQLRGKRRDGGRVHSAPLRHRGHLAERVLRGRQHRRNDGSDHLVHHCEQSCVIALQGREHHAGRKRVDRAQTLKIESRRRSNGENGGPPGRIAAVHHEKQRGEGERGVAGRAAVAAGREIGEEGAMGLQEVENEGVALAKHQEEIVEVEEQGEDALEGIPVEGGV